VVDLKGMTCTCRSWQISGKPCPHAITFITYLREENLQLYVDRSYTIEKFRAAYKGKIPAMTDKKQWPKPDKGFFLYPPLLRRPAGRQKHIDLRLLMNGVIRRKGEEVHMSAQSATNMGTTGTLVEKEIQKLKKSLHCWQPKRVYSFTFL
jgi:hypothetical protein